VDTPIVDTDDHRLSNDQLLILQRNALVSHFLTPPDSETSFALDPDEIRKLPGMTFAAVLRDGRVAIGCNGALPEEIADAATPLPEIGPIPDTNAKPNAQPHPAWLTALHAKIDTLMESVQTVERLSDRIEALEFTARSIPDLDNLGATLLDGQVALLAAVCDWQSADAGARTMKLDGDGIKSLEDVITRTLAEKSVAIATSPEPARILERLEDLHQNFLESAKTCQSILARIDLIEAKTVKDASVDIVKDEPLVFVRSDGRRVANKQRPLRLRHQDRAPQIPELAEVIGPTNPLLEQNMVTVEANRQIPGGKDAAAQIPIEPEIKLPLPAVQDTADCSDTSPVSTTVTAQPSRTRAHLMNTILRPFPQMREPKRQGIADSPPGLPGTAPLKAAIGHVVTALPNSKQTPADTDDAIVEKIRLTLLASPNKRAHFPKDAVKQDF
jgi:hypothetical protein